MLLDLLIVKLLSAISTSRVMEVLHGRENFLFGRKSAKRSGSWLVLIREELIVPSGL
jgi:hypothetical protein